MRSPEERTAAARTAVAVVFGVNGFAFASWASRLPAIRDNLHLSTQHLGFVLLAISVGSVSMLPLAGAIVRWLGPARTVTASALTSMTAIAVAGLAPSVWVLAGALLFMGAGIGAWDVAMNVEGAEVERRLGRSIMPRFHAAFSLGTVAGAAVGALAAGLSITVRVHLPLVAVSVLALAMLGVRNFLVPAHEPARNLAEPEVSALGGQLAAWFEGTTLLIGVLVFSMALAEGSANDWLALSLVDGYGAVQAVGAIAFGVFVTGMTAMRMLGPALLDRYDHGWVLRASAGLVFAGTGLVILGAIRADGAASPFDLALAMTGALLWGAGAALGFPMGMTAAAADPTRSAARVGVVATIGYTAFLAGPPLLGTLGQRIGTAQSLVAVTVAVLLALVTAGAVRQPQVAP